MVLNLPELFREKGVNAIYFEGYDILMEKSLLMKL